MADDTLDEALPGRKKKKGGSPLVMTLLVALVAGGGAGAGAGWFLADRALAEGGAGSSGGTAEAVAAEAEPAWELFALDNLVVNPAGTQGRRFLVVSASIEVDPERTLPLLQRAEPRIRDGILRALGAWGVEELTDASRRADVEALVQRVVREVAGDAPVGRVYFSQFLLQ